MTRQLVPAAGPWAPTVGYSRAVRVGNVVHVAGTTAIGPDGAAVGKGDAYRQTQRILEIVEGALREAGAGLEHVVRTRIFTTDISQWQAIGRAHGERFRDVRPAATMVEVRALIDPDLLVEIEVDAIVPGQG